LRIARLRLRLRLRKIPGTFRVKIRIAEKQLEAFIFTHPASSIYTMEKAPLSRGDFLKSRSMKLETGNSPLERGGCEAAGVCLPRQQNAFYMRL
jgi:hypothetical protein